MTTSADLDKRKDEITALVTVARIPKAGDNRQAARPASVNEKAGYLIAGGLVLVLVLVPLLVGWVGHAANWLALAGERSDYAQAYEARLAALEAYEQETGEAYDKPLPPKAEGFENAGQIEHAIAREQGWVEQIERDAATFETRLAIREAEKQRYVDAYVRAWKNTIGKQGVFLDYAEDQLKSYDRQWKRERPEILKAAQAAVAKLKAEREAKANQ